MRYKVMILYTFAPVCQQNMSQKKHHGSAHSLSLAGLIITLGIIYGDIGTSPLYVFDAILRTTDKVNDSLIYGAISCVFWTLTLQTTFKYVIVTLMADNRGEGGIFSLFSLVRRKAKWLVFPAMIGGCALLADGIITPPISVSSAVEGLELIIPHFNTVPFVMIIIAGLFLIQQFGTNFVGKVFGPIMFLWFSMLGVLGMAQILHDPSILKALNPYYAVKILMDSPSGIGILGAVFLCTTGAEALYSDLGHCGRENIRVSWIYVKICLVLNYCGQGVNLLKYSGHAFTGKAFYAIMPQWFLLPGIIIATMAAIIASQALISGSFTLISEAVRLNFWPRVKILFPTNQKGQLYAPGINWLLLAGCLFVVWYFEESSKMEAAYGLSITLAMLMTTILVCIFLASRKVNPILIGMFGLTFLLIETTFFIGNMQKFMNGGWFTIMIGFILFSVMWTWHKARKIKNRFVRFISIDNYYDLLKDLSMDETVPKYASNLVYLTSANYSTEIESKILYSIINQKPKRADVYWLVHVDTIDQPYNKEYKVQTLIPGTLYRVDFKLGFREQLRINFLFHQIIDELVQNKELDTLSRHPSLRKHNVEGEFRFIVTEKVLSDPFQLDVFERFVMYYYFWLKKFSLSEEKGFGLDLTHVTVEQVPLILSTDEEVELKRIQ
jgi:KUP system potassium uptake protein